MLFTVTWKLCLSKNIELTRENFRAMIDTYLHWYNEFNRGHHSLSDEFRKNCPKSVVGPKNINAEQKLIMKDRHVTYYEIKATLGISYTSIYKILH